MARKDKYHDHVRAALENDGWTITDDPLYVSVGRVDFKVDLGAEKLIAAEKDNRKIAVEIKSFLNNSPVQDMHEALGKYQMYELAFDLQASDRVLYLAIPERAYSSFFQRPFIQELIQRKHIKLIVYYTDREVIDQWIE